VFNFDAHRYRASFAPIDLIHAHILGWTPSRGIAHRRGGGGGWRAGEGGAGPVRVVEVGPRKKIEGSGSFDEIAAAGYQVPWKLTPEQSSHHEALRSIVLRAMMRAVRG